MKTLKILLLFILVVLNACKKSDSEFSNNPGASDLHNKVVGASANDLLASAKYKSLKIEVQYMTGYAPDPAALADLKSDLRANGGK